MGCKKPGRRKLLVMNVVAYFMISMCTVTAVAGQPLTTEDDWIGPYVDKIRYVCINGSGGEDDYSAQSRALIAGDIDMMTTQVHEVPVVQSLRESENVEFVSYRRSAVWPAYINCEDSNWPLNISGVRHALHYAINKTAMNEIQGTNLQDSYFIPSLPWSIESEMNYHYYNADAEKANEILDGLGFIDIDHDGWREGPHGEEIPSIMVEFNRMVDDGPLMEDAANLIVDAFESMNMSAYSLRNWEWWTVPLERVYESDFCIMLDAMLGYDLTPDSWVTYWQVRRTDWKNATYDGLAEVVRHSIDYDEVVEALKKIQYILIEDAPGIPVMQMPLFSAYRTDSFEGFVEHPSYGPHSFFTGLNVRSIAEDSTGTTIRWGTLPTSWDGDMEVYLPGMTGAIHTQNFYSVKSHMEMMHDSLAMLDPNLDVINWIAKNYTIETHTDDSDIPVGNTRILVNIVDNAMWSDGTPLTAEDVSFSINWFMENHADTHEELVDLCRCVALTGAKLEVQFTTESFWHWYRICFIPIIPLHAPDQYDPQVGFRLSPSDFNEDLVVSGPFMASEWVKGEYIELVQNPYYWRNPKNIPEYPNDTSTTGIIPPSLVDLALPVAAGAIGAASVIIVGGIVVRKRYT